MRAHKILVKKTPATLTLIIAEPCELTLKATDANRKLLVIICNLLRLLDGSKTGLTFKQISHFFGYVKRQWSNNFFREFKACGDDILSFLQRENRLKVKFYILVEKFFLENPLLSITKSYQQFKKNFPHCSISYPTFRTYLDRMQSSKIIKRFNQLLTFQKVHLNIKYCLQELLQASEIKKGIKKESVKIFPNRKEVKNESPLKLELPRAKKYILVAFLFSSGLNEESLAHLFGVCQTCIHNWLYKIATESLVENLIQSIHYWSGKICVDEKWIKSKGIWYYVFSALEQQTGFPLWMRLFPQADTNSGAVFFQQIKLIYGIPSLIISDGGYSLLKGKNKIFPHVVHQLCKFHQLRNLFKLIYKEITDTKTRNRVLSLTKHIFSNKRVSNRKRVARTLSLIVGEAMSAYICRHILSCWRKLTKSLTNNAAERFNRKIEKCIKIRYGIKNEKSAQMILRTLWLKEFLLNGKKHIAQTSVLNNLNIAKICQANLNINSIDHFLSSSALKDIKIAA